MKDYQLVQKFLTKDWYTQGFNAYPIFLINSAYSGFPMIKQVGYGYTNFLFHFQKGYGEMNYLTSDFKKIWRNVKNKLTEDSQYLKKVKKEYTAVFNKYKKVFNKINSNYLKKISDDDLIILFKKCAQMQIDSVGIAHIVDAIGIEIEKEFKKELLNEIKDKKEFNNYYLVFTSPLRPSFLTKEENDFKKIATLSNQQRKEKLRQHLKKYFWIQNSYAGPKEFALKDFRNRLKTVDQVYEKKTGASQKEKDDLIKKLKLSPKVKKKIEIINFTTVWQDERKANILKAIGYLGKVINEISRRIKIDEKILYYLKIQDVFNATSLDDIRTLESELKKRNQGSFYLYKSGKEYVVCGKYYNTLIKFKNKLNIKKIDNKKELYGSTANCGTAVGKAVICKSLSSIYKVKEGNILVASMTRSEFMPALKKSAAIITDEGSITCHAAIISRELGVPCIIGTKIATKVLRDGDLVEVDANCGVVKILKQ